MHSAPAHAFHSFHARTNEGLTVCGRRSMLKASLAGIAGLSLPRLLQQRAAAAAEGRSMGSNRSVILLWMAGGPSHIDTWDMKPSAPVEIRGPFGHIPTRLPGVVLCEHLPKQAAMMDKLTLIRSVDARHSNHQPNQVMQTANSEAEPRLSPVGDKYPAIGSIVAQHRGANQPGMPAYAALNVLDRTHIAWGGWLGQQFDPFLGDKAAGLFQLPAGLTDEHLMRRADLHRRMDVMQQTLGTAPAVQAADRFTQQAIEMVTGRRAQAAFDLARERPETVARYGDHPWCRHALLARRLVEAGTSFVTLVLSNHHSSGTWDTHGDNIPPYGGIQSGLKPLLPVFDHLLTTLVSDLVERGLLDEVLVLAMGEFGRTPQIGTQGSTDGRNHWPYVMSAILAGGGYRHGQVIGASERDGGQIKERPVTPGDLAATIYRHMQVPLDVVYLDSRQRPRRAIESGAPLAELG